MPIKLHRDSSEELSGGEKMKVKYWIEPRESEFLKKQFFENVSKLLGTKAITDLDSVTVEVNDEERIIELLRSAGMKYQKAV